MSVISDLRNNEGKQAYNSRLIKQLLTLWGFTTSKAYDAHFEGLLERLFNTRTSLVREQRKLTIQFIWS